MNHKTDEHFWPSYVDLMTSIFFVMLVLFAVSYYLLNYKLKETEELKKQAEIKASELEQIHEIQNAISNLAKGSYFEYNDICKRFELRQDIIFQPNSAEIPKESIDFLIESGNQLKNIIDSFRYVKNVKLLIIIEGRAAKYDDEYRNQELSRGVRDLSYSRAYSLYSLWLKNGIICENSFYEVLIAGSGFGGQCRYEDEEEGKNKKFIIQLITNIVKNE